MVANTIKELPVTLKSEAINNDFNTNIKQKITVKNEKVPEVFSLRDNVLLYGDSVVIPKKLQNRTLRDFHTGHPVWFGLVWFIGFYGISTFVGYLTPNPFLSK